LESKYNEIVREQKVVEIMIQMYCIKTHKYNKELCSSCKDLKNYAFEHLNKCKYGNRKPTCRNCETHCYSPAMKEKIISVMRFSGPRMIFYHPIFAFQYITKKLNVKG